jgi:hypothetical protein
VEIREDVMAAPAEVGLPPVMRENVVVTSIARP